MEAVKSWSTTRFIIILFCNSVAFNAAILIWRRKINWYGFLRYCLSFTRSSSSSSLDCFYMCVGTRALMAHNTDRHGTRVAAFCVCVITAAAAASSLAAPRCCLRHKKVRNSPSDRYLLSSRTLCTLRFSPLFLIAASCDAHAKSSKLPINYIN